MDVETAIRVLKAQRFAELAQMTLEGFDVTPEFASAFVGSTVASLCEAVEQAVHSHRAGAFKPMAAPA